MQLKSIKVAGFKSFADPTTIPIQHQITAVVGPNGCGKSNIVDAIRCVLSGAARQLRGGSMPDIIFNGSANRKPVGQASVEMTFDNRDGSLGGSYASYAEIAIRREINRDGSSNYYLNGARCRRRDVTDVFLGTGLGPQSYSIIEQGMISRLIDAKPEELRIYLEEAAGISKYKERRRETENRMQHTRENLERLSDHRAELEKQLSHLKRQANAAERYKELKQEERQLKGELQALLWRHLKSQIAEQEITINEAANQLEAKIAEQRQLDVTIEKQREEKNELSDAFTEVQDRYYTFGAEIARLEQQVKNTKERQQQLQVDLQQLEQSFAETTQNHEQDQWQISELDTEANSLEPQIEQAKASAVAAGQNLVIAEEKMTDWQMQWDEFSSQASTTVRAVEVEQMQVRHLEQNVRSLQQRIERSESERQQFQITAYDEEIVVLDENYKAIQNKLTDLQTVLDANQQNIAAQRQNNQQLNQTLDVLRNQQQQLQAQQASLHALQQVALGKTKQKVTDWLGQHNLNQRSRLAENLQVATGWETAAETVLGPYLEAICVDNFNQFSDSLDSFVEGDMTFLVADEAAIAEPSSDYSSLLSKITSPLELQNILSGVYVADTLAIAITMLPNLNRHQSVVTKEGIWLGKSWLRIAKNTDIKAGVLQREAELKQINLHLIQLTQKIEERSAELATAKQNLEMLELQRQESQRSYHATTLELGQVQTQLNSKQAKVEQWRQREIALTTELSENRQHLQQAEQEIKAAQENLQQALAVMQANTFEKERLQEQREQYRQQLDQARGKAQSSKQMTDELQLRLETARSQIQFMRQSITRAEKQLQELDQRRAYLQQGLVEIEQPLQELNQTLETALTNRLTVEHELTTAKQKLSHVEFNLRQHEQQRDELIENINVVRQQLEQLRMQLQALQIKQSTHLEKITELEQDLETLLAHLAEVTDHSEWETRIAQVENRIQRLGAINLAAIEEFTQLSERKTYLDAQNDDLVEALTTLENAIKKIDRETKEKLKETYDQVNQNFSTLFQRVFNGGNASLELTEDDFLNAGIILRAQPPGKRNTTIHLLSGGEKALTAVALVFALFQLNPSPFCVLDEVDAPLDDLNVGRFCKLVKEMSPKVQFIFISHNKLAIECAEQLIGVTMNEPGVSRLVSVDIDQAIAMATA